MLENNLFDKIEKLLLNIEENSSFYKEKFKANGIKASDIKNMEDFRKLPFTCKEELRDAYPLGLQAVDERDIVRIHSSSGTTGKPVIIPYTKKDIENWAEMMCRCYKLAGIDEMDRIQITPGYGLWTAGIGFQYGVEKLGALAIPIGPGNTEKQLNMLIDLKSTVLIGTSSYGLVIAEQCEKLGLRNKLSLKKGIFGSERWGEKMRTRIEDLLQIETFDIYGLTEVYGPGIAMECEAHEMLHYFDDHLYFEIIDPITLEVLPDGELGELVITTLTKEGAPLLRYRTRDLTRIIPNKCSCGCKYPGIDRIFARTDDMFKVKGVNIFPGQIEELLKTIPEANSEYQIIIEHLEGKDNLTIKVEVNKSGNLADLEKIIFDKFKTKIGISAKVSCVVCGSLPRSEKKTKRVLDLRNVS